MSHKLGKMRALPSRALPSYLEELRVQKRIIDYCLLAGVQLTSLDPVHIEGLLNATNATIDQVIWQVFAEIEMAIWMPLGYIFQCGNVLDFITACDLLHPFRIARNNWSGSECVEFIKILVELHGENKTYS